jgi:hypothetical protein
MAKIRNRSQMGELGKWYRAACDQHALDLAAPQRFPLHGDRPDGTGRLYVDLFGNPIPRGNTTADTLRTARYLDWKCGGKDD